jgi:hypothetical protein
MWDLTSRKSEPGRTPRHEHENMWGGSNSADVPGAILEETWAQDGSRNATNVENSDNIITKDVFLILICL